MPAPSRVHVDGSGTPAGDMLDVPVKLPACPGMVYVNVLPAVWTNHCSVPGVALQVPAPQLLPKTAPTKVPPGLKERLPVFAVPWL